MLFDMPDCGGCRTCEMACGFQHTGEFCYSASSLRILDKTDRHGYSVQLLEQDEGTHFACHGCQHLDEPLCVLHCREAEQLTKMIEEFIRVVQPEPKAETKGHAVQAGQR
jgi:Fe-S-cluster-containing dehydrogenase component